MSMAEASRGVSRRMPTAWFERAAAWCCVFALRVSGVSLGVLLRKDAAK